MLAAIRQAFRLPDAASTATVSGCKSSVSEMTGKRSASTQTIATASNLAPCPGEGRDAAQRNRHSQRAARVTTSQIRLRIDSISCTDALQDKAGLQSLPVWGILPGQMYSTTG